ncbi:phospholipase [Nonlabens sp. MB-3u-79]|uniref:carboxylesterase family protein n=1 Tax=Nonlabens sp. MB-3u-79 TaxID=2058134 RepID=UPI000C30B150|nr:alpha/beta hydrolase-fold protein [Nonlabens sp. MB-3u-79]AUC80012.1 phospholipase [Nonlabens sp. MB-3u-79]
MNKNMRGFLLTCTLSILGANLSVAQSIVAHIMTAADRHKLGGDNVMATAQTSNFEARTYVNNENDTLLYRLLRPINYDPNKKYPLVICLSGSGGRGTDNIRQIAGCWPAQILSKQENREKYPAFIFVPQCPQGSDWGRSLGVSEKEIRFKLGSFTQPSVDSIVLEAISTLEKEFNIDIKRRYVTGQSMGGYGTWHFILNHPEMFAAAIPICGGGNPSLAQNIVNLPVWVFHGQKDSAVPVDFSRNMVEAIKKEGGDPNYNEFSGAYHVVWPLAYDTPGLLDWLFAQNNN